MNHPTHIQKPVIAWDAHNWTFGIDPIALICLGLLVWSLWGLWLWLDLSANPFRSRIVCFLFGVFCGPAAWLFILWTASHKAPTVTQQNKWEIHPQNWRNN